MKKYVSAAANEDDFMKKFDALSEDDKTEFGYTYLKEYEIATEDEIDLVTDINGYNYSSMCDILYVRAGYRDFDQLWNDGAEEISEMLNLDL